MDFTSPEYQRSAVHWMVPLEKEQCEYSLIIYYILLTPFQNHMSSEKKWHTFSGFGPTSLS